MTRVWFPGLDLMVEAHIQHCHPCQVVTPANEREHNSALLVTHLIFLTQLTSSRFSDGHKFALLVTCLKFCTL